MPTQDRIDLLRQVRTLNMPTGHSDRRLTAFTSNKPVAPLQLMQLVAALRQPGSSPPTIH